MIIAALLAQLFYPTNSWSVTVNTDLATGERRVWASLLELDEDRNPVSMQLDCEDGRPDFSIEWYGQKGPDMLVVNYGEADSEQTTAGFRRDKSHNAKYHYEGNVDAFMAKLVTYKKPTFLMHFDGQAKLAVFVTPHTAEAWRQVKAACKPNPDAEVDE